jgi:hypothetical protein
LASASISLTLDGIASSSLEDGALMLRLGHGRHQGRSGVAAARRRMLIILSLILHRAVIDRR